MQTIISRVLSNSSTEVIDWRGGDGTFFADGSFASGTLLLEASIDGGVSWQPCKDAAGVNLALSADGIISFSLGPCKLRSTMSGATVAAGTLQVETLTATTDEATAFGGNVKVTVTSPGILPAARVFTIWLDAGMTRTEWMARIYDRLVKDAELAPYFVVSQGAANNVVLTKLAPAAATDASLNIAIANVASGVTDVASSTNTTAGVLAVKQVETFTVAGTVTKGGAGNVLVTVTAANRPELVDGLAVLVRVESGDTASVVAGKVRAALAADRDIGAPGTGFFDVSGTGADVVLTDRDALPDDATMNIAYTNGTCAGLTPDATAVQTTAGVDGVTSQVVTATVVGTITASGAGLATVTVTATGQTWSPKVLSVALADGSTEAESAEAMRVAIEADADLSAFFTTSRTNAAVALTCRTAAANLATTNLNVAYTNDTCAGLTPAATSANTTSGVAGVAQVETLTVTSAAGVSRTCDVGVTVTGAAIGGSPRKFPVRLTAGQTVVQAAAEIRLALDHPDVTTAYTVGGTGAAVVLTARNRVANDGTLNMSLVQTPGLTAYPTSTGTTAGVVATPNVLVSMQNR